MYKIFLVMILSLGLNAYSLVLKSGEIKAHTEVFGDSTINPSTKLIESKLTSSGSIESIKGSISINPLSLKSDSESRDEHMHTLLKSDEKSVIMVNIISITKKEERYVVHASLTLNGVTKEIESIADISDMNDNVNLRGKFNINLTSYNITPPSLVFFDVRDQIDITYNLVYTKG